MLRLGSYFVCLFYSCGFFNSRDPFENEMVLHAFQFLSFSLLVFAL